MCEADALIYIKNNLPDLNIFENCLKRVTAPISPRCSQGEIEISFYLDKSFDINVFEKKSSSNFPPNQNKRMKHKKIIIAVTNQKHQNKQSD